MFVVFVKKNYTVVLVKGVFNLKNVTCVIRLSYEDFIRKENKIPNTLILGVEKYQELLKELEGSLQFHTRNRLTIFSSYQGMEVILDRHDSNKDVVRVGLVGGSML